MLKDFVAYEEMPLMILENIAPQFALFNGSIVKYKGALYLTEDIEVNLKSSELMKLKMKNLAVMQPLDLRGGTSRCRLHQLPKHALLVSVNDQPILSDSDLKGYTETSDAFKHKHTDKPIRTRTTPGMCLLVAYAEAKGRLADLPH